MSTVKIDNLGSNINAIRTIATGTWTTVTKTGTWQEVAWSAELSLFVAVASSGYRPISIIWFAQVANGILLPIITIFLLWIMNTKVLGQYKNSLIQNLLGGAVFLVTLLLSGRSLMSAFGLL